MIGEIDQVKYARLPASLYHLSLFEQEYEDGEKSRQDDS